MMSFWLQSTFEAGGTVADIRKVWESWPTTFPRQKSPLLDVFDRLCKRAEVREMEISRKANQENLAQHQLELARSKVERAELEIREIVKELKIAQDAGKAARADLVKAERAMERKA